MLRGASLRQRGDATVRFSRPQGPLLGKLRDRSGSIRDSGPSVSVRPRTRRSATSSDVPKAAIYLGAPKLTLLKPCIPELIWPALGKIGTCAPRRLAHDRVSLR